MTIVPRYDFFFKTLFGLHLSHRIIPVPYSNR